MRSKVNPKHIRIKGKTSLSNKQKRNTTRSSGSWTCSPVLCFAWLLITLWVGFIALCWNTGLITKKKVDSLVSEVENVEKYVEEEITLAIDRTESKLLRGSPFRSRTIHPHNDPDSKIHIVFSTDCSPQHDWQTLVLFHSAKNVGQKGKITRIASGCDETKMDVLPALYKQLYEQSGHEFGIHFTPDFMPEMQDVENPMEQAGMYNKPNGLYHWLSNAEPPIPPDAIISVLDPESILLRPITTNLRKHTDLLLHPSLRKEMVDNITIGHPVAQTVGVGTPWTNDHHKHFNRKRICGEGSPCLEVEQYYGELHYSVGPPLIAHKSDLARIVESWIDFLPRVYEGYPFLMAELYAYNIAAAHERIPHLQLNNLMVSNAGSGEEAWAHVDGLTQTCSPPDDGVYYPGESVPTVLHYCQWYRVADYAFHSRKVDADLFTCEHALFQEPPVSLGLSTYRIRDGQPVEFNNPKDAKRYSFVVCTTYDAINSALVHYKQRLCTQNADTNYEKTYKIS